MSEIQKGYIDLIRSLSGEKKDKWRLDYKMRTGYAGVAITFSVLNDGILKTQHLKKRILDFTNSELRMALRNLRRGGYFQLKKGRYLVTLDHKTKITDPVWWGLLANVAQGYLKRK